MCAVQTEYDVVVDYPIKEPIRIAQFSDIHERQADDILAMLDQASPDLIVVTGDTYERYDNRPQYQFERRPIKMLIINFIHYTNYILTQFQRNALKPHTKNADEILKHARSLAPVVVSLGNHEQKLRYRDYRFFQKNDILLLDNADTVITVKGTPIHLGGMSSWDFEEWLERFAAQKDFRLLLCHHPERFEPYIEATDIPLTLSGHTHGGQFRVGNRGRGFFVPGQSLFGKYAHGQFFDGRLIVSAGCSNTVAFPRLFNPRELVVINLRGKSHGSD